jgi:hypothetical protein
LARFRNVTFDPVAPLLAFGGRLGISSIGGKVAQILMHHKYSFEILALLEDRAGKEQILVMAEKQFVSCRLSVEKPDGSDFT